MNFHLFEFFAGELAGLVDDVFRHRQLADVVEERGDEQRLHQGLIETHQFSQFRNVYADPQEMAVRALVFGFNCHGQAFNGAQVQSFGVDGVLLAFAHKFHLGGVGSVNGVDHGDEQQRGHPAEGIANEIGGDGEDCADNVKGQEPEEVATPEGESVGLLVRCNDQRQGNGIREEVDGCGDGESRSHFAVKANQRGVGVPGKRGGGGDIGDVEQDLKEREWVDDADAAKCDHAADGQAGGLKRREQQNPQKDEGEVERHGAFALGQSDLHSRAEQNGRQVDSEVNPVLRRMSEDRPQTGDAANHCQAHECFNAKRHAGNSRRFRRGDTSASDALLPRPNRKPGKTKSNHVQAVRYLCPVQFPIGLSWEGSLEWVKSPSGVAMAGFPSCAISIWLPSCGPAFG